MTHISKSVLNEKTLNAILFLSQKNQTEGRIMKIEQNMSAIVTGGASGLGRATATALAGAGFKVAIFDLNEEAGQKIASSLGGVFCKTNILDEDNVI